MAASIPLHSDGQALRTDLERRPQDGELTFAAHGAEPHRLPEVPLEEDARLGVWSAGPGEREGDEAPRTSDEQGGQHPSSEMEQEPSRDEDDQELRPAWARERRSGRRLQSTPRSHRLPQGFGRLAHAPAQDVRLASIHRIDEFDEGKRHARQPGGTERGANGHGDLKAPVLARGEWSAEQRLPGGTAVQSHGRTLPAQLEVDLPLTVFLDLRAGEPEERGDHCALSTSVDPTGRQLR
jgi:hypothetical protein